MLWDESVGKSIIGKLSCGNQGRLSIVYCMRLIYLEKIEKEEEEEEERNKKRPISQQQKRKTALIKRVH